MPPCENQTNRVQQKSERPERRRANHSCRAQTKNQVRKNSSQLRPPPSTATPSPAAYASQDTTAEFLLQRGALMRQRFIAAMQPAQEVFAPAGPYAGTAQQTTNATIALTIAKAEAQYAEILTRISAVETTIATLTGTSVSRGRNQPPPLTAQEAEQINNIFIVIKAQAALPTQPPTTEVKEAPTKLNSFVDRIKGYVDTFSMEAAKSAGEATGKMIVGLATAAVVGEITFVSLCYLLIDQLTELGNLITNWLSTIATFVF